MQESVNTELLVSVDVGCYRHAVAIGLPDGGVLEEFEIDHDRDGFAKFLKDLLQGMVGSCGVFRFHVSPRWRRCRAWRRSPSA